MKNKIDISVIIPMFNAEKYIEKAINSILSQEKHSLNYEIIVVDDFSKDNSTKVVKSLNNNKIKLIELKENQGTAKARNTGLRIAQGKWIQFLDSDDSVCNDLYKKFEMSIKPEYNCYIFSLIIEYFDYTLKQRIIEVKDKRVFGHFGGIWNKFIKREICMDFKPNYSFEDVCFIVDMMKEKDLKVSLIDEAYYFYNRKNNQSKMENFNEKEFRKMFNYVYSQIDKSDYLTKMFILRLFINVIFSRKVPFLMSLQIATKTSLKLYKYLPVLYLNRHDNRVINTKINSL